MDTIFRALAVYLVLLLLFRIAGRKAMESMTTFDFVLTLIISEAVQEGLVNDDKSLTGAFLLVTTLIGTDVVLSLLKRRSPLIARLTESLPLLLMEDGKVNQERCAKERVDRDDILAAARANCGLVSLGQVKHAVLERDGQISIIPQERSGS